MASSIGSSRSSYATSKVDSLTCRVCLEVFREPKFLSCFHSFCKRCLERLPVQRNKLKCPTCRRKVKVPTGGVSAFQSNFHIDNEELEKAREGAFCVLHPRKEKDLFCMDCQMTVCTMCMLTDHKRHKMEDIVKGLAKAQLTTDQDRLEHLADELKRGFKELQDDMQAVLEKREVLAEIINKRHRALYKAADRVRDEAMDSLRSVTGSIRDRQTRGLQHHERNVQKVTQLQQQLQEALDSEEVAQLSEMATEMRDGCGSKTALQKLKETQMTTVRRPILRSNSTPKDTLLSIKNYMGCAAEIEVPLTTETTLSRQLPDVSVRAWAYQAEDKETEVCGLFSRPNGKLTVQYEPTMTSNNSKMVAETFRLDGTVANSEDCPDEYAALEFERPAMMDSDSEDEPAITVSLCTNPRKFSEDTTRLFELSYEKKVFGGGRADITLTEVTKQQDNTGTHMRKRYFHSFFCSRPYAFDVHVSGDRIAVLEVKEIDESEEHCLQLYTRAPRSVIATYNSPITPYRPSDVFFFTLGGQEVLLVTDELNDAIHVVSFKNSCLTFMRYLALGCPLLVQPIALTEDFRGHLLVACRDGKILVCTPTAM